MSETIKYRVDNGIGTLTLNRPQSFNSFNREMALEFLKKFKEAKVDNTVRVILITGEGKAFCAGQDLVEVTNPELNPGFERILDEHFNPIIKALRSVDKPVIAAVNGVAAGAGANVALACDIIVAKESASFIQAFSAIGLVPDSGGTFFLPRLIGFQKAMAISMLGDKIKSKEAEEMGMIYKSVADDLFEEEISQLALRMSKMPTYGLALTKRAYNASMNNTLEEQLKLEKEYQLKAASSQDYEEGVAAFLEKRKPTFKGK